MEESIDLSNYGMPEILYDEFIAKLENECKCKLLVFILDQVETTINNHILKIKGSGDEINKYKGHLLNLIDE